MGSMFDNINPEGTLSLDIYIAQASSTAGLYVPNLSTTRLGRASVDVSTIATATYPDTLTNFTYTGVNLSANTNYAFYLDATDVIFEDNNGINFRLNLTNPYPNGNYFNNDETNGVDGFDMSGQIDVTAVPEPGTMILFGVTMAIGGAAAVIRKRRKRNAD